jgi:site-specific DNA-methyltransferase (adenine-specific)
MAMEKNKNKKKTLLTDIYPNQCEISVLNTRYLQGDENRVDELAEEMKIHGFEPTRALWGYENEENGKYKIFAGGRRLSAAKRAEVNVAVLNYEGYSDDEIVQLSDYDNKCDEYHVPVHWVDEVKSYVRLRDLGWTQERIAKAKGIDRSHISKKIRIYDEIINNAKINDKINVRETSLRLSHLEEILVLGVSPIFSSWLTTDAIRLDFIEKIIYDIQKNGVKTIEALRKDIKTFKNMLDKAESIYKELDEEVQLYKITGKGRGAESISYDFYPRKEFVEKLGKENVRTLSGVISVGNSIKRKIENNISEYDKFVKTKTKISDEDRKLSEIESKFICGDGIKGIKTLKDKSVTLLLTDPPYGKEYQSNRRWVTKPPDRIIGDTKAESFEMVGDLLDTIKPKLKADAHLLIFCDWRGARYIQQIIEDAGYKLRSFIVWVKEEHSAGDIKSAFAPRHEIILHATQGDPMVSPRKSDVFNVSRVPLINRIHPTQKPVELLMELIESCSNKDDLIVDPFAGVASTLLAAIKLKRNFKGWEVEKSYHLDGTNRLLAELLR